MLDALYSAADIARRLGVAPQTVTRRASMARIGRRISGAWVFSQADFDRLSLLVQKKPGNPKMVAGNELWRRRKKLRENSKK